MTPIVLISDDFTDNAESPAWGRSFVAGSATKAETSGQARFSLPSSTAGTHQAYYWSSATYDLNNGSFYINIQTMVATGVAASAVFDLYLSSGNALRWIQTSGTLKAQTIVGGVVTDRYSVAWNASTYKYLRIREGGGNVLFDSSTNGTSWTGRAAVAAPFDLTALSIRYGAECGNVASPGSFRLDDVNLILPVPSATWLETTADWGHEDRRGSVTLASDGGKQGVLVTADTMDSSRVLGGTVRYFAGPLGSSSGGYLQLTEYASLALAQASAFPIPVNGRVDFPAAIDSRLIRLYHRSIDASAHNIYEFVPRRLVQADDIEAESIKAINISAGAVTADKISVFSLSAITASMGSLHMDGPIDITTGSLVGGGGVVTLSSAGLEMEGPTFSYGLYNPTPVTLPSTNMLHWSKTSGSQAGSIIGSASSQLLMLADKITLAIPLSASDNYGLNLQANGAHSMTGDSFGFNFGGATGQNAFTAQTHVSNRGSFSVHGTFNSVRSPGSARFALDATTEGSALSVVNNGTATPFGASRVFSGLMIISETAVNGNAALFLVDGGGTVTLVGAAGATWSTTAGTASKTNVYITGSAVTIENKLGSTASYNVVAFRSRTS